MTLDYPNHILEPKALELREILAKENFYSCLVYKQDQLVFEYYKSEHQRNKLQKMNSCTKSFVSALVGIALERGLIGDIDMTIGEFFPTLRLDPDPLKLTITIRQLLTMSAGFDWPEFGKWNYTPPMLQSDHWVDFVLNRPLKDKPGIRTNYNTGCSQLLTAILQQVTGDVGAFIEEHLLTPLEISNYRWLEDPQGNKIGGYGLYLKANDLLKFGTLFLYEGVYRGKRIVSKEWVEKSTRPSYINDNPIGQLIGRYAYHWWCNTLQDGSPYYFAIGFGGQAIIVVPKQQMVVVMTGENYSNTLRPINLFKQYII